MKKRLRISKRLRRMIFSAAAFAILAAAGSTAQCDTPLPQFSGAKVFNIVDYGAVPDGRTLDTDRIQRALDDCSRAGGGVVRAPAGVYLTGTLILKDNDTLSIEAGATLLGSTNIQDYKPANVIRANGATNVSIVGHGVIDGRGYSFWTFTPTLSKYDQSVINTNRIHYWKHNRNNPGNLVFLTDCSNVKISDVTLQNSESWTCDLLACENVAIDGIRIRNRLNGPNTDGIDVNGCQDVQISNCDIYTGDDAIVLKNRSPEISYPHSCRNVTVARCTLVSPTNGFKIGTETYGDFEKIVFEDSIVRAGDPNSPWCKDAASVISPHFYGNALGPEAGIAIESVDGAHIRAVTVRNIEMHSVQSPIFIRLGSRGVNPTDKQVKSPIGTIDDIAISNVTDDGAWSPSIIAGVPGHPVRGVTISGVKVTNIGNGSTALAPLDAPEKIKTYPSPLMFGSLPATSLYIRHADNVKLTDFSVTNIRPDTRAAVIGDDAAGLTIDGFTLDPGAFTDRLILLNNVRDSKIRASVPAHTANWVTVSGPKSTGITLAPEAKSFAGSLVAVAADVPGNPITIEASEAPATSESKR